MSTEEAGSPGQSQVAEPDETWRKEAKCPSGKKKNQRNKKPVSWHQMYVYIKTKQDFRFACGHKNLCLNANFGTTESIEKNKE